MIFSEIYNDEVFESNFMGKNILQVFWENQNEDK